MEEDKPGFWEERGYHNRADAFLEERFSNGPVEDSGIGNATWEPEI
jgi:DMSO/TMAO reductase YedYZ molybdopterin-dependent catalytic subunit